ncbi:MAG: hypothetical protein FIA97_00645 [Methylococcaceae bacterium]|nr:hypothetical protein [Methylococcaceae bacterium]
MKNPSPFVVLFASCLSLSVAAEARPPLDCGRGASLAQAVARAKAGDSLIFTGSCAGPVEIIQDDLSLTGQGAATIDGNNQHTVLLIRGARNVKLAGFDVQHGINGIQIASQAQASLNGVNVHDNAVFGIAVLDHAGAALNAIAARGNGVSGLDVENTSAVAINGSFTTEDNRVFGINVNNGSSLSLNQAALIAQRNLLGIQIGTGANVFLADKDASITARDNASTGLTVVSGSHLVSFGGRIEASGNGRNGVSVNSKAGLDLDAASVLESHHNGANGVQLAETSVMTLFNTTGFSGVPGDTTLKSHDNGANGIAILSGSNMTLVNQVVLESRTNHDAGVLADNGSAATLLNATLQGNGTDLRLSFGARADIRGLSTVDTIQCDPSVLSRGDITCPAP